MHILQVLKFSPPFGGGMVDHLSALGEWLAGRGDRITYAFPIRRPWFETLERWGDVLELPEIDRPSPWGFGRRIRQVVEDRNIDLLHVHFAFSMILSLASRPGRLGVPCVYHWHNPPRLLLPDRQGLRYRALQPLGRAAARFGDRRVISKHVAVSCQAADALVAEGWAEPEKVVVCPNALTAPARVVPTRPGALEDPVISTIANFRPQKDHGTLLRGFRLFLEHFPGGRLKIVGDGPLRPVTEALAGSLGVENQVEFMGFVPDPQEILRSSDIFALCTRYEGHPLAVLEAMAHARPVVATDLPSVRSALGGEAAECLVPSDDPAALSRAFSLLCRDGELRRRLGEAGRRRVETDFRMEAWVARMSSLYEEAMIPQ